MEWRYGSVVLPPKWIIEQDDQRHDEADQGPKQRHHRHMHPLLGHAKLDTSALYTRVATNTIGDVMSPLDRLTPLKSGSNKSPA
jgi:hypothetical protein